MLLRKSICVCIPCFKSVVPRTCMAKESFFGSDINIEMGVVIYMYLNIPQVILIPNIYVS